MALIACPDCEEEIGEKAQVCPHCGSVIDEHARQYGAKRRQQIIIHGSTAVGLCVVGCLLGGFLSNWLSWEDTAIGLSVLVGGGSGFLMGSVLGFFLAQKATQEAKK